MDKQTDADLLEYLQTIPGLDVARGLANLSGNVAQYHQLLAQLDSMFWSDINQLAETLMQCEVQQASSLVHSLKGAAGTLGLTKLYHCAITLETQLRSKGERIDAEVLELAQALSHEMSRFHHYLSQPGAES